MSKKVVHHIKSIVQWQGNLFEICDVCRSVNQGIRPCTFHELFDQDGCVRIFGYNGIPVADIINMKNEEKLFRIF